jgi:D-arabinose 1-dehydrogenase-like Zn-dependent alcohol dehydrogenase
MRCLMWQDWLWSKGGVIRGINVGPKSMLEDVVKTVANHNIAIPIDKTFGFSRDDVVKAYEHLASGSHIGKVCIIFD